MVLDDFKQIRPTDILSGKGPDPIAVDGFLRPAKARQH
jgi:hypothetical protein